LIVKNNLPLYKILTNLYQVKFTLCEEVLSVAMITPNIAKLLDVSEATCVINLVRKTYERDMLIEVSEAAILSSAFKWEYTLTNSVQQGGIMKGHTL